MRIMRDLREFIRSYSGWENSTTLRIFSYLRLLKKRIIVGYPIYTSPFLKIKAGKNVRIDKNCVLKGEIKLEDDVFIGENSILEGDIYILRNRFS